MSLNWDTTRCNPPLPKDDDDKNLRTTLIWGAMAVDLGSVTAKNVDEWMFRLKYQEVIGLDYISLYEMSDKPDVLRAGLTRWIGLSTNVPTLPRKKWLAKVTGLMEKRVMETMDLVEVEK